MKLIFLLNFIIILLLSCSKSSAPEPVAPVPVISTNAATNITSNAAVSGGNIISDGGAAVIARGVCWSTSPNPTLLNFKTNDGAGIGIYSSNITGLNGSTLYYLRSYATNNSGTVYGNEISFTTSQSGIVTLCSQVWMDKNLSVSSYRNGDPIPLVTNSTQWQSLTTGAYCFHNNDPASEAIYGKLYNWYAVNDPRGLAPSGWHVPSLSEWGTLISCVGGSAVAGGALKETGFTHWAAPNTGATNSSGFTALPGGYRANTGTYSSVPGTAAHWWSSSALDASEAIGQAVWNNNANINTTFYLKTAGYSVRCVKN